MGLDATAKGLDSRTCYSGGNITYANFMAELVKTAYDERCYSMFYELAFHRQPFSPEDEEYWNSHCNDDLDIWIWHSNCDGEFTPQECRKVYKAIKDLRMDFVGHNYGVMEPYNMLEHWKYIFKHCADRRVVRIMAVVYVLSSNGTPLMPTTRCGHVRILLKEGKACFVTFLSTSWRTRGNTSL